MHGEVPGPVAQEAMEKMETEVETLLACWLCIGDLTAMRLLFKTCEESVKPLRQQRFQPIPVDVDNLIQTC